MARQRKAARSGPGQSVQDSIIGRDVIQIGSAAGDVVIMLDRPEYRLEFLEPVDTDKSRSEQRPSYLLDPRWQVVPYRPRLAPEIRLATWRNQPDEALSALLLHGPGGQGKTRLASHFASQAYENGWAVAQAVERSPKLRAGRLTSSPLRAGQPLLVVVDYAERWRLPVLGQMVDNLRYDYPDRTVRMLLLARPQAGLWRDVRAELGHGTLDLAEPEQLGDFTDDLADREGGYRQAVAAFASWMNVTAPLGVPRDLADAAYRSPLTLHMAALAAVCAQRDSQPPPTRENLSDYLLDHEARYWQSAANIGLTVDTVERAVFVSTLLGPVADLNTACVLLRRARLADGDAHAQVVIDAHDRLYPSTEAAALPPLRPDRFGEDFVARYLRERPRATALLADLLAEAPNGTVPDALSVRRCLSVLSATAARQ